MSTSSIPVIDVFAGPGGLSEGFSSVKTDNGDPLFDVVFSIEMETNAYETLKLRSFFRHSSDKSRFDYYKLLRQEINLRSLYEAHTSVTQEAEKRCWQARLGPGGELEDTVRGRIRSALNGVENWVLIGGPPCQAYSIAGRSRNSGNPNYDPGKDVRQRLYIDYLQILADHRPAVFVIENVKGLLSATLQNELIFKRIMEDLRNPAVALVRESRNTDIPAQRYRVYSLVERRMFENGDIKGSVVTTEKYGIPQSRHRVILLGVREDIGTIPQILIQQPEISVEKVIGNLPYLRSGISKQADSVKIWVDILKSQINSRWANGGTRRVDSNELSNFIKESLRSIKPLVYDRGGEFIKGESDCQYARDWYLDNNIGGICNHSTRSHMIKDLYRYFYAACYAKFHRKSPTLNQFPKDLLPDHANVKNTLLEGDLFSDRFRVQIADRPSTTIVSHISKDGHYYIHPDPAQCRSLTVREAARLQTFPDNYYFCGHRTSQYIQVGNAVPPLLAKQIANIVYKLLNDTGVM
jgi:DNA (cytosine-5)-methyltransferase 1